MENTEQQNLVEQSNYKNYLKVYLMSKASGNNSELLSISSGFGMGKISLFSEALLEVNQELNKAGMQSPLSFEVVEIGENGLEEKLISLIEEKMKIHSRHIVLIDGVEKLTSVDCHHLVQMAKQNQASIVFSSNHSFDDRDEKKYVVSTNMAEFIDNKFAKELNDVKNSLKAKKEVFNLSEDLVINSTLMNAGFDKSKIKSLRQLGDDEKNSNNLSSPKVN